MTAILNRIFLFLTGSSFIYVTGWLFDYVLYPFVIFTAGLSIGFVIMVFLSFLSCVLMFFIYDYLKKDFLAIEYSKEKIDLLITDDQKSRFKRAMLWILKRSRIALFVLLSVYDPFIATVFMRKGAHQYNGLKARDWRILAVSLLIGNGIWAVSVFTGLTLFQYLYEVVFVWSCDMVK